MSKNRNRKANRTLIFSELTTHSDTFADRVNLITPDWTYHPESEPFSSFWWYCNVTDVVGSVIFVKLLAWNKHYRITRCVRITILGCCISRDASELLYNSISTDSCQKICSLWGLCQGYYLQGFALVYGEGLGRELTCLLLLWFQTWHMFLLVS